MKMNVLILGMLLLPFCSTAAQADPDRPTSAAVPTSAPPAIDPATGLPVTPSSNGTPAPAEAGAAPTFRGPPTAANPAGVFPGGLPGANPLASGAIEEESNLNLGAAMTSYQSVISQFDAKRPEAANAIFRLGECYRKLGRLEEAKVQYARILREFTDQVELVKLSEPHLFAGRPGTDQFISGGLRATQPDQRYANRLQAIVKRSSEGPATDRPSRASATTAQQQEISRQLVKARQALAGLLTTYADKHPVVVEQQAKIASLQRQLADLTDKPPRLPEGTRKAPGTAPSADVEFSPKATGFITTTRKVDAAPAADPVGEEKALIQEQIQLVKKKLARLEGMQKNNLVSEDALDDVRMQLLSLQRDLAAWEARYAVQSINPPPPAPTSPTPAPDSPKPGGRY